MMSPWLQPIDLAVRHVSDARERMPIIRMHMGEDPQHAAESQPMGNDWVRIDVFVIIVIDESVIDCPAKYEQHHQRERCRDPGDIPVGFRIGFGWDVCWHPVEAYT
jgi:hypothetical protein